MSAGNHAQALAWHARRMGVPATIVMPEPTPLVKVENTARLGARVVLHGETLADRRSAWRRSSQPRGRCSSTPMTTRR